MATAKTEHVLNMSEGKPLGLLLRFSLPVVVANILQQLYNIADTTIAGHMLGETALSQIGTTTALYALITNLAFGMNSGLALSVSNAFGAQNDREIKQSVAWMTTLAAACAVILTVLFVSLRYPILRMINTPSDLFSGAMDYIEVIFIGIPITMAYNLEGSLMQAVGNSRTPLILLLISSVLNIALDYLFMGPFNMGVRGAAIATIIAQGVSAVFGNTFIWLHYPRLRFGKRDFKVKRGFIADMLTTGVSMALTSTIYNIGGVLLQSSINGLGNAYITAQVAARRLVEVIYTPGGSLSLAVATYSSQNLGAGKRSRIAQGARVAAWVYAAWWVIAIVLTLTLGRSAVQLITASFDETVVGETVRYLNINIPLIPPMAILVILRNMLQGMQHRVAPLMCSIIEMAGKVIFALWIVPVMGYTAVCICEPVMWVICCIYLCIVMMRCKGELRDDYGVGETSATLHA